MRKLYISEQEDLKETLSEKKKQNKQTRFRKVCVARYHMNEKNKIYTYFLFNMHEIFLERQKRKTVDFLRL